MTSSCSDLGFALGPTQWVRCQISGPLRTQLGLGMAFLGLVWVNLGASQLGWVYLGLSMNSLTGQFMPQKTTFLESKPQLSSVFCTFLGFLRTCPGNSKLDPPKKGCEVKFGRRGKLTMSSNRRASQAQLGFQNPKVAQETPRRPPQEVLDKICISL